MPETPNHSTYAVIMAGGGGTRLWPLSRQPHPKQTLQLIGDRSLFQLACDRLQGFLPPEQILVVTTADLAVTLQAQVPNIPADNFLLEPMPRGTASVVGLAAAVLQARCPSARMCVLTADHYIADISRFQSVMQAALTAADQGWLVTLGIPPTFPATGYGYIQRGESLGNFNGQIIHRIQRFKEKPDLETAQSMCASGGYDWNSGMFFWRVDRILVEFARWMPDLSTILAQLTVAWGSPEYNQRLHELWPTIQPQTIDYGIMERAEQTAVVPAQGIGWNDVGSWESLFEALPGDAHGNIILSTANHLELEDQNSLIYANTPDRLVVTVGLENMIVVDTPQALLVCPRHDAQKVRQVITLLKQNGMERYL